MNNFRILGIEYVSTGPPYKICRCTNQANLLFVGFATKYMQQNIQAFFLEEEIVVYISESRFGKINLLVSPLKQIIFSVLNSKEILFESS